MWERACPRRRPINRRKCQEVSEPFDTPRIPLALHFFRLVRAIPRPRADFRVVAASIRALFINSAQTALTIQVQAIVVAHALQGEDFRLLVVTLDDPFLLQALGNVLRRITALELVDDTDADQILDLDLDGQGAAAGHARA